MNQRVISILAALQKHQDLFAIVYILLAVLSLRYATNPKNSPLKILVRVAAVASFIVIAGYVLVLASYVVYPNYRDHTEVTVASVAWMGMHGKPYYPDWMTEGVYGLQYGPVLYLLDGLSLLIYPTIAGSKLPAVLSLLVGLAFMFAAIKKVAGSNLAGITFVAAAVLFLSRFNEYAYWNRAEPFLVACSALSLLFLSSALHPLVAASAIGALAGIAAGFKIHGFVYIAPAAIMTFVKAKTPGERIGVALVGLIFATVMLLLPFCLKQSSLAGYVQYLTVSVNQGLSPTLLKENVQFAVLLVAPAVAIWFWRRSAVDSTHLWGFAGLCACVAVVIIIGSKHGAGSHHLVPFVPLSLYAAVAVSDPRTTETRENAAVIFVLLLLSYGPAYILNGRDARYVYSISQGERDKINELQSFLNSYPNSQMGVSDDSHYRDTYYRVIPVLQGRPLQIDFMPWMDLQYVGVPEAAISRFLKQCEIPTWILPLGEPFKKSNFYTDRPLLSDEFRNQFLTNYRMIQRGQFYQVWECRSSAKGRE